MQSRFLLTLFAIGTVVFVWSAIEPHDRYTWFLEVLPALMAAAILFATRRRFPLSPLLYVLITIHAIILMVGGKYTYAEVPLGFRMQEWFGFSRNHYDRIGHFAQGFVPAMVAREILIRFDVLKKRGAWLNGIICAVCLAISALYELVEWAVAVISGTAAEAFLGTQGDVWDTQMDMLMALLGAMAALALLSRAHDRSMEKVAR